MKKTVISLALLTAISAQAEVVTVTGYGKNFESALANAKTLAVEQVTGTWLNGEESLEDSKYSERITQYNGGVIKKYDVIKATENEVTIRADVDVVKDNRVGTKSFDVPASTRQALVERAEKNMQIGKAVEVLDDKNKAFQVVVKNVQYANLGANTEVTIQATIGWSPKWISDVGSLAKTVDQKNSPDSDLRNEAVASMTIAGMGMFGTVGAIVGSVFNEVASAPPRPKNPEPMVCFGSRKSSVAKECYNLNSQFSNFMYSSTRFSIVGTNGNRLVFSTNGNLDNLNMYNYVYPGSEQRGLFNVKYTYDNPALIVYKDEMASITLKFTAPTNQLANVEKFNFVFN